MALKCGNPGLMGQGLTATFGTLNICFANGWHMVSTPKVFYIADCRDIIGSRLFLSTLDYSQRLLG